MKNTGRRSRTGSPKKQSGGKSRPLSSPKKKEEKSYSAKPAKYAGAKKRAFSSPRENEEKSYGTRPGKFSRPAKHSEKPKEERKDGYFDKQESRKKKYNEKYGRSEKPEKPAERRSPARRDDKYKKEEASFERPARTGAEKKTFKKRSFPSAEKPGTGYAKGDSTGTLKKPFGDRRKKQSFSKRREDDGLIRLNKYISNTGICSRREADELIKAGAVSVNGKIITEMGYMISPDDNVNYGGQKLSREKNVYLLLNKPKDYITTSDDPQKRKTVMELIRGACRERVYPVGRLDRNTTGLLLFTNDGEMAKMLTHPRHGVKKIYHTITDKAVTKSDLKQLTEGIELEDTFAKADEASYVADAESKKEVGVVMHTGQNRVVRRMFEALGYKVVKLDRVYYAGLTKKDLPRGKWRILSEKEVNMLKMVVGKSKTT